MLNEIPFQFEALRRVHLIPASSVEDDDVVNANMFRNLDSPVSEGGDNFSTGWVVFASPHIHLIDHVTEKNSCCVWLEPSSNGQKS